MCTPALLCFALAAAAPRIAAAAPAPCEALLADLTGVAHEYGYDLTTSPGGLSGIGPEATELRARCDAGRAAIDVVGPDGAAVRIEVTAGGLHVHGEFPGVGRVSQSWARSEPGAGDIRFTADTGAASASAVFDLDSGAWAASGDPAGVNTGLEPTLAGSAAWRDAHALLYGLTGVSRSGLEGDDDALDAVLDVAIPLPGAGRDVDKGSLKKDCGATIGICAVAYFWKPATAACIAAGAKCLSAFKCWKNDCSGDGKK